MIDDETKLSQEQLEQPAKVYQLFDLKKDIKAVNQQVKSAVEVLTKSLDSINTNTKDVVTKAQMEAYVDKRIDEKTEPLWSFKKNVNKLAWLIVGLLVADIVSRLYK